MGLDRRKTDCTNVRNQHITSRCRQQNAERADRGATHTVKPAPAPFHRLHRNRSAILTRWRRASERKSGFSKKDVILNICECLAHENRSYVSVNAVRLRLVQVVQLDTETACPTPKMKQSRQGRSQIFFWGGLVKCRLIRRVNFRIREHSRMFKHRLQIQCLSTIDDRAFTLLLHATGTVCHYTKPQNHLCRLSDEEAEAVLVQPQLPVLISCSTQLRLCYCPIASFALNALGLFVNY